MDKNFKSDRYYAVKDGDGELFYCPLTTLASKSSDLSDCVGSDVVGRYAGKIDIVRERRENGCYPIAV